MVHCFLSDGTRRVDLTEGNRNGKNGPIDTLLFTARVSPDISEKEEYRLYRQALTTHGLRRNDMAGIDLKTILKAREAALALLKVNMERAAGRNHLIGFPGARGHAGPAVQRGFIRRGLRPT